MKVYATHILERIEKKVEDSGRQSYSSRQSTWLPLACYNDYEMSLISCSVCLFLPSSDFYVPRLFICCCLVAVSVASCAVSEESYARKYW